MLDKLRDRAGLLREAARTVAAVGIVSIVLAICFEIHRVRNTAICFALLLAILWIAVKWGRAPSIIASIAVAFGFAKYFLPSASDKFTPWTTTTTGANTILQT